MRYGLLFILLSLATAGRAQTYYGRVTDAVTREGLPFATVRIDNGKQGVVTDLKGNFVIDPGISVNTLEISYLGYQTQKLRATPHDSMLIQLSPSAGEMNEFVFTPPYEKIRRILDNAIANRDRHNPDKYDWYRCHVYYKMAADIKLSDSAQAKLARDTSSDAQMELKFLTSQHLLMTETYSIRTWKKPQQLQEEVLASRFSGFKKSLFTGLVTDVLPFHAYTDYLTLNAKDYHNPVSKGYAQRYDFNLNDEVLEGSDTLWILSFRPRTKTIAGLKGTVYINSDGYAIAYFLAQSADDELKRTVKLEQQYQRVEGKWFPRELNYILQFYQVGDGEKEKSLTGYSILMKGNSLIDSVSWASDRQFKFDKTHPVKLTDGADERNDSAWSGIRPVELDAKESRTYQFNDSIIHTLKLDLAVPYLEKLVEGKFPIGPVDLNLGRVYSFNRYEGSRLGLGAQTNEKILSWASIGGWAGYGFKDQAWKYGGFLEFYGDKYKEFSLQLAYSNDIRDPGRLQLHRDLDRSYLRNLLMFRVDKIESFSATLRKRMGYLEAEVMARQEEIIPKYAYALNIDGEHLFRFTARELVLSFRYAFAERRAPLFNKYYSTGTKYPIVYAKLTGGMLTYNGADMDYVQALAGISWTKHINRLGNERIFIMAGKTWSGQPLPISKLFAGNGLRYEQGAFYFFGGMLTMYPYEYYSDQFLNVYLKHDFDRKFYSHKLSAPSLSLAHNMLYGTLQNHTAHRYVDFSIPVNAYHESGVLLNSLGRLNYMNVFYLTLNVGYFYHWAGGAFSPDEHGKFVFGIGAEF